MTEEEFRRLLGGARRREPGDEVLKMHGASASSRYLSGEAPSLTQAVFDVVQNEGLTDKQAEVVAQQANQAAWRQVHHVEGAGAKVTFEPADASAIGAMRERPSQAPFDPVELQFHEGVPDTLKHVAFPAGSIEDIFGVQKDTPEYDALIPKGQTEAEASLGKVASERDEYAEAVIESASLLADLGARFQEIFRTEMVDNGVPFLTLCKIAQQVALDADFAESVAVQIGEGFLKSGHLTKEAALRDVKGPIEVDSDHPFCTAFRALERAAFAHYTASETHEKLAAAHATMFKRYLKKYGGPARAR